jgi:pimeloyl-ACP methyl ester carboxylesterase
VVVIDALAHGESERMIGADHSLSGYARRALAVCEAFGISKATWIGTSYGGSIAMQAAIEEPRRVDKLVLIAPAHPFASGAMDLARWYGTPLGTLAAHVYPHVPARVFQWGMARMFADPAACTAEIAANNLAPLKKKGTIACVLRNLANYREDMRRLEAGFPKLKDVPVRMIWGDCDPVVSFRSAGDLARQFSNIRVQRMERVGHLPYEERPKEFERLLIQALSE